MSDPISEYKTPFYLAKILIVDDDKEMLKFLKIHLNQFFSNITICDSPKEALKLIKTGSFDLILSDIVMPKLNGIKLLKEIRLKKKKDLPVILFSGYVSESNRSNAKKLNINEILEKPLDLKLLYLTIRKELEESEFGEFAKNLFDSKAS